MATVNVYRGRFAPSPTGPLHAGSLVAAVASYLHARHCGGQWFVRIEDLDPPREIPGAAKAILKSLEAHALFWDADVIYQSARLDAYHKALENLQKGGRIFSCVCTRSTLGPNGNCEHRCEPKAGDVCSVRLGLDPSESYFDEFLGEVKARNAGTGRLQDLVLKRKDGLFAYALAVVVDDVWQRVTHVIRGDDLLGQTDAQRQLHRLLGNHPPRFGHVPVLRDAKGHKLSKQAGAAPIQDVTPVANLRAALHFLQQPSATAEAGSPAELLMQAVKEWRPPQPAPVNVYPCAHNP